MMVFSQYNANNAPAEIRGNREMELRGTKGTMYFDLNGWEVVPAERHRANVPARTPVDRNTERSYRPSQEARDRAEGDEGPRRQHSLMRATSSIA